MFSLQDSSGHTVLMRDGQPFTYSTRATARTAQRLLSKDRGDTLTIVDATRATSRRPRLTARVH